MLCLLFFYMIFHTQFMFADKERNQQIVSVVQASPVRNFVTSRSKATIPMSKQSHKTGTTSHKQVTHKIRTKPNIIKNNNDEHDKHNKNDDYQDNHIQTDNQETMQKLAHHTWPKKDSLIKNFEKAITDIPQRSNDNRKTYREKVSIAFKAYQELYDYNRSSKMFVTTDENHRIMQAVEKLFKHKHIENMVWHTNILKN